VVVIYRPKLEAIVSAELLEERTFFKKYQRLRNICLLVDHPKHQLVILLSRENKSLASALDNVMAGVSPQIGKRIRTTFVEDCIGTLGRDQMLSPELRIYASQSAEKYIIPSKQLGAN
jgi:hypothetical protein